MSIKLVVKTPKVKIYQDTSDNHKWRWQIQMSSDIVAASSQGYYSEAACKQNLLDLESHISYLRSNNQI